MGKIVVEQHVTADGFAAGLDGELDWVDSSITDSGPMVDIALDELTRADAILLGANTYRLFIDYWPDATSDPLAEPINRLPKHIVSSTLSEAPWGEHAPATIETGTVVDIAKRLKATYSGDIMAWGSLQLTAALLEADAVDELRLRVEPVLLGRGLPLWQSAVGARQVSLTANTTLTSGQTVLVYSFAG